MTHFPSRKKKICIWCLYFDIITEKQAEKRRERHTKFPGAPSAIAIQCISSSSQRKYFLKKGLRCYNSVASVWMEATTELATDAGKLEYSHVCGSSSSVIVSILQKCLWREERRSTFFIKPSQKHHQALHYTQSRTRLKTNSCTTVFDKLLDVMMSFWDTL